MKILHTFKNMIILLILSIIIGAVFITAANYFPIQEVKKQASLNQLDSEGYFPEVPSTNGGYGSMQSMNPTALELATDNLFIKMALYDDELRGIEQAFRCYSTQFLEEYSRYWHGYVVLLRPLLFFFDYYEIRILNGFLQFLLFAVIFALLYKQKGLGYSLAFGTSYALLMPLALTLCLQYSWIYYITFGFFLLYLRQREFWEKNYCYLFLLIGIVTIYIDLLTYPLLSWGFIIVWMILLEEGEHKPFYYLQKVVLSGLSWILGYAGMWIGKWIAGSIVLRDNLFKKAISEAMQWTVDGIDEVITLKDRYTAIMLNWKTYSYIFYFLLLAVWVIYWLWGILTGYRKSNKIPALLLTFVSPIVWFFCLSGHALMHHIFTHRIYGVSIAALLATILLTREGNAFFLKKDTATGKPKDLPALIRKALRMLPSLFGIGILSLLLLFAVRDTYTTKNYDHPFDCVAFQETATMEFCPDFAYVEDIYFGLSSDAGAQGGYTFTIRDMDTEVFSAFYEIPEGSTSNVLILPVQQKFTPGKKYSLTIVSQTDSQDYVWLTQGSNPRIIELGTAILEGNDSGCQILSRVDYFCRPVGRSQLLFWFMTLYFTLLMGYFTLPVLIRPYGEKSTKS